MFLRNSEVRRKFETRTPQNYKDARREEDKKKEEAAAELKIRKEKKAKRAEKAFAKPKTRHSLPVRHKRTFDENETSGQKGEKKKRWSRDKRGKNAGKSNKLN